MVPQGRSGKWHCHVKKKARQLGYLTTPKGRARQRGFRVRETCKRREARIERIEEVLRSPE